MAAWIGTLMDELRAGLAELCRPRLEGGYLFGSCARGEQDAGSDVLVPVVLKGFEDCGEEVDRAGSLAAELSLAQGVSVCGVFVGERDWLEAETTFCAMSGRGPSPVRAAAGSRPPARGPIPRVLSAPWVS